MNEELKDALRTRGAFTHGCTARFKSAKAQLEAFDASSRCSIKADGIKRTEADTDALVTCASGREKLVSALIEAEAELSGCQVGNQCLLAETSLVCAEVAAMSRIAGQ